MKERLLWIDFETTGLDPAAGLPLEIAVVLTDEALNETWSYRSVIHQDLDEAISLMSPYVLDMHQENGLIDDLRQGRGAGLSVVENHILNRLLTCEEHADHWAPPRLAGSKPEFDRAWLRKWFPRLVRLPHYRDFDLSTVRALLRVPKGWGRVGVQHRALDDLRTDIALARKAVEVLGEVGAWAAFEERPETTASIYGWGRETFGECRDPAVYIGRALQEFAELVGLLDYGPESRSDERVKILETMAVEMKKVSSLPPERMAQALTEVADVRIVLEHVTGAAGGDGQAEVDHKMAINRRRRWEKSEDGTSRHVE